MQRQELDVGRLSAALVRGTVCKTEDLYTRSVIASSAVKQDHVSACFAGLCEASR